MSDTTTNSFHGLGIAPKLLDILQQNRFTVPTPIQAKAIPVAIEGKDLIGIAQTGTGKTLAFGVPMLQNLARVKGQGLILSPTRELAEQVEKMLLVFGRALGLRTAVIIGGASMIRQIKSLNSHPHIMVATPGRLIDHLQSRPALLKQVSILVIDEADRMLDMGFAPQIDRILKSLTKKRQTMLFSATMPPAIIKIAQRYMTLPIKLEIARSGTTVDQVDQEVIFVAKENKQAMLDRLLKRYSGATLVFTRTKWGAKKLAQAVKHMGHTAAEIHSNRSLGQRRDALEGFKRGTFRVLVATDIAARGIDVKDIEVVLNYDLPSTPDDYVHRIGRTARAGARGRAISFATPDQKRDIRDIERLIRTQLPVSGEVPPAIMKSASRQSDAFWLKPSGSRRHHQYHRRPPSRRSEWEKKREYRGK